MAIVNNAVMNIVQISLCNSDFSGEFWEWWEPLPNPRSQMPIGDQFCIQAFLRRSKQVCLVKYFLYNFKVSDVVCVVLNYKEENNATELYGKEATCDYIKVVSI